MLDLYNSGCRKVKVYMHIDRIVASRGCRYRTVTIAPLSHTGMELVDKIRTQRTIDIVAFLLSLYASTCN